MIYMFLSNNPSSGDINSSNLSCSLVKIMSHNMTVLYPNLCKNDVCHKKTVLYYNLASSRFESCRSRSAASWSGRTQFSLPLVN